MYACVFETGCGFFEEVCASSNATAHSYDPFPTYAQRKSTGALSPGLRPEEDHAPRNRGSTQGKDDRGVEMTKVVLLYRTNLPYGVKTHPWSIRI
jgi:hypothetical protein